ncbi:hypothetical protein EVAR_38_1 [Eumeta japonica]|uniref:Uncharacterized protein n=1 Tax=Eumeta variegata TaxID=151549 RepID=A0A4C1SB00_EUMVA|nr:hypothetical protein EVAR_38_1 [Eumeta japonica]
MATSIPNGLTNKGMDICGDGVQWHLIIHLTVCSLAAAGRASLFGSTTKSYRRVRLVHGSELRICLQWAMYHAGVIGVVDCTGVSPRRWSMAVLTLRPKIWGFLLQLLTHLFLQLVPSVVYPFAPP